MTGPFQPKKPLLEIACFDAESAIVAWKAGADRIELCQDRDEGGTSPSLASVTLARQVAVPIFVMIRPRGGDFVYTAADFEQMKKDIDAFKPFADGFVFGLLTADGQVDVPRMSELVRRAAPLPCTFHRAFDEANDLSRALEDAVSTGCQAILSSGGKHDAQAGISMLESLVRQAGDRIQILPGGGVRAKNIVELRETTGATMFHSSGIPPGESSVSEYEINHMKALLSGGEIAPMRRPSGGQSRHDSSQEEERMPADRHLSAVSIGGHTSADMQGSQRR